MEKHLTESEIKVGDRVRFHSGTDPGCWMEGTIVNGWHPDPLARGHWVSMRVEASAGTWARAQRGGPEVGDIRHPNPILGGYFLRAVVDPLDVEHDGVKLRLLLEQNEMRQRTERPLCSFEPLTPVQRAAVSAHWSAQLRAKVTATVELERLRERSRVLIDIDEP